MKREINPVRTIVVDGERVRVKRCRDCGETKRVAEDKTSEFSVNIRRHGRVVSWKPYCKPCYAVRTRARYRKYHDRIRKRQAELRRARLRDPAERQRERERQLEWREAKLAEDPEYFRDLGRINYRLRLERAGREPKRQMRREEPRELIPNAPVREAVVERLNGDADLGWERLGVAVFPGVAPRSAGTRLRRALGESPATNSRSKRTTVYVYYQARVSYEIALRVVEILGLDPIRAGV